VKAYYGLAGCGILLPSSSDERPDPKMLEWHRETIFRG
jgi:hypothetical protein